MAKAQEIRGRKKHQIIGTLAGWGIRMVGWTLRYEIKGLEILQEKYRDRPVIYACWHSRIFVMPYTKSKLSKDRKIVVLTSASKDGAILENAVAVFKIGAVRGSSSRRGVAALIELRKKIEQGANVCITPDGPRGPRQELQPGIVKLAQFCGVPIIAINVEFSACLKLKTWDQFRVPFPFSKVYLQIEEGIDIPREMNAKEFEDCRSLLENKMNQANELKKN